MIIESLVISGMHRTPKTFRYGTIVRILIKNGAKPSDLYKIENDLNNHRTAKFKKYELSIPNGKVWSETKTKC